MWSSQLPSIPQQLENPFMSSLFLWSSVLWVKSSLEYVFFKPEEGGVAQTLPHLPSRP